MDTVNGYHLEEVLGEGTYGKVYKATKNGTQYALKTCVLDSPRSMHVFKKEVGSLVRCRQNSHCVPMHKAFMSKDTGYIVMDMLRKTLLQEIQQDSPVYDPRKYTHIFLSVCEAVSECHKVGVAHLDIKPDNILLSADGKWFISDFGCSTTAKTKHGKLGSHGYAAPEVVSKEEYSTVQADIFSLGVLLHVMLTGNLPQKCEELRVMLCDVQRLPLPCLVLISSMLSYEPEDRPSLESIMKNSWLRSWSGKRSPTTPFHKVKQALQGVFTD
jgi:serine/threonine protein kinase